MTIAHAGKCLDPFRIGRHDTRALQPEPLAQGQRQAMADKRFLGQRDPDEARSARFLQVVHDGCAAHTHPVGDLALVQRLVVMEPRRLDQRIAALCPRGASRGLVVGVASHLQHMSLYCDIYRAIGCQ
jgi:hypothetical protein